MLAKALQGAATAAEKIYIESVFSTFLYTGNGSTQTITNGIDLSGKGGLVWIKSRLSSIRDHRLFDTARGTNTFLASNTTDQQQTSGGTLTAFNSSGFDIGAAGAINTSADTYASWTFRKAAKFFDVVTYAGTGSTQNISHNLGSVPGFIFIKQTNGSSDWWCYHRSLGATQFINLNTTGGAATASTPWNNTAPTSTVFTVGTLSGVNASGGTYVAYLFAHDAGGFGDSGNESVIKCGSYTGTGTAGLQVNLGWEPQWLLVKNASAMGDWRLYDTMRGLGVVANDRQLYPHLPDTESNPVSRYAINATGFEVTSTDNANTSGNTYIYIAIRRGPMKTPTDATKVFNATVDTSVSPTTTFSVGFPADSFWTGFRANAISPRAHARLTGNGYLSTADSAAELTTTVGWDKQNSLTLATGNGLSLVDYFFRRAPGFFDVVAYVGVGNNNKSVSHNLKVAPELMFIKSRSSSYSWRVYIGLSDYYLELNSNSASVYGFNIWANNTAYADQFILGPTGTFNNQPAISVNASGVNYIAYLFATCPGVSKVGSYTGTGTTLNVDCGFTSGARFVLIKRTDSTGDWYVWDTARGIVSGNDPSLLLNSTAAEVTNTDYIDPLSSGFQISSTAPAAINASGGSFIFLAIA